MSRKKTWFNDEAYVNYGGLVVSIGVLVLVGAFLTLFIWAALQGGEGGTPPQQHAHDTEGSSLMEWTQLITAITGLVAAIGGLGLWARKRHIAKKGKTCE